MRKSKSFSSYGRNLDRISSLKANPQSFKKREIKMGQDLKQCKAKDPKWIQGFDRLVGRNKLSSFQQAITPSSINHTSYQISEKLTRVQSSSLPLRRETSQRLGNLIKNKQQICNEMICMKNKSVQRNERVLTTKDLQNLRKTFHSFDFDKQTTRNNTYIKKQIIENDSNAITQQQQRDRKVTKQKLQKTHSFQSYTRRSFLEQKRNDWQGASEYSGVDAYKIPLQKFKAVWKTLGNLKFKKKINKVATRYDTQCNPWFSKLGYNPNQKLTRKRSIITDLGHQSGRKINQVHSKYPMRLAI